MNSSRGRYPTLKRGESETVFNLRLAVSVYDRLYKEASNGKNFMNPSIVREMKTFGTGKWIHIFKKVNGYIQELLEEHDAHNDMRQILVDYFTVVLRHYWRWKRFPTLKQLTGPTAEDNFRAFIHSQEVEHGAYWISSNTHERMKFNRKYGWGDMFYDPVLPHTWTGPGRPDLIPALNKAAIPIRLGFRELVEYRLLIPPQEDIDLYNRLWVDCNFEGPRKNAGKPLVIPPPISRKSIEPTVPDRIPQRVVPRRVPARAPQSTPIPRLPSGVPARIK